MLAEMDQAQGRETEREEALKQPRMCEKAPCQYWPYNFNDSRHKPMNQSVTGLWSSARLRSDMFRYFEGKQIDCLSFAETLQMHKVNYQGMPLIKY